MQACQKNQTLPHAGESPGMEWVRDSADLDYPAARYDFFFIFPVQFPFITHATKDRNRSLHAPPNDRGSGHSRRHDRQPPGGIRGGDPIGGVACRGCDTVPSLTELPVE